MDVLEHHPQWSEKKTDFDTLTDYLQNTLCDLQISGAIVFGSWVRCEKTLSTHSDIDIVAYSDVFSRESAQQHTSYILSQGGEFFDKEPLFLEDFISPRIEYFIRFGNTTFDINIFPTQLWGYDKRYTNATHDSLDVVIGAMYVQALRLFGTIPFEQLLKKEFLPFYCDDLRSARMYQLESRIRSGVKKLQCSADGDDSLYQIYKTRAYLIKWMFINARKYPVDYHRYLHTQLTKDLQLSERLVNALLLKASATDDITKTFIEAALEIIPKE